MNRRLILRIPTANLSDLLSSAPKFSFFDKLIDIPAPPPSSSASTGNHNNYSSSNNNNVMMKLGHHDIFKISKIVEDIHLYLIDLLQILLNVSQVGNMHGSMNLEWYFEGSEQVLDLLRNIESIDSIISQLLAIIESNDQLEVTNLLLKKFEEVSDDLLEVKKFTIVLKKNLDIAKQYHEINQGIIKCLTQEIEDCIKCIFKLREMKLTSPRRALPKFQLSEIISKMRLNDISATSTVSIRSIRLPTFNETDEKLYSEYLEIESKIGPLRISLHVVPIKIEEFNTMCTGRIFNKAREEVLNSYERLLQKWNHLQREMKSLKRENLDIKWNEIFQYLMNEIINKCDWIIEELSPSKSSASSASSTSTNSSSITDEVGVAYKLCSNSITLINKAFKEDVISDRSLLDLFNDELLPKWEDVNELIGQARGSSFAGATPASVALMKSPIASTGLKLFRTVSRNSVDLTLAQLYLQPQPQLQRESKLFKNGLGIDFGVDVESIKFPFSVEKKDRVKELGLIRSSGGKSVRNSLLNVFDDIASELEEISFDDSLRMAGYGNGNGNGGNGGSAGAGTRDVMKSEQKRVSFDLQTYLKLVLSSSGNFDSRIPEIFPNYIQSGYPKIEKKVGGIYGASGIPEINPTHPVFQSPIKKTFPSFLATDNESTYSSEKTHVDLTPPMSNQAFLSSLSLSNSSLGLMAARPASSLLNETQTPNLLFGRKLNYNSTSPERPLSSLGSRYDDEHLLQSKSGPIRRPSWK